MILTPEAQAWFSFLAAQRKLGRQAVINQAEAARRRLGLPPGHAERQAIEDARRFRVYQAIIRYEQYALLVQRPQSVMVTSVF